MELLNQLLSEYGMELLGIVSPIVATALMHVLPPQYGMPVAKAIVWLGEKAVKIAETKGGFSNEKANTTNTPS